MTDGRRFGSVHVAVLATTLALVAAVAPGALMVPDASATRVPGTAHASTVMQTSRAIHRRFTSRSLDDVVRARRRQEPQDVRAFASADAGARVRQRVGQLVNRSLSTRPDARQSEAAAEVGPLPVPVVRSTPVSGATPGLRTSFQGLNLYQERYVANGGNQFTIEPPDPGMCVGNGFVMESVNNALRVFTTRGRPQSPPIDLNSFYGYPAMFDRTAGVVGPQPVHPSCLYDSLYRRWIHVVLTLDVDPDTGEPTLDNHVDIAVSKTANPLRGWNFYSVNTTNDGREGTPRHTDCPCTGDFPHIAADRNGVYITTNEYPIGSSPGSFGTHFNGAQLYAFSRRDLTAGRGRVRVTQLSNLALAGRDRPIPAFSLIGANSPAGVFAHADRGSEYFLSTVATTETGNTAGRANVIGLWTLSNTRSLNRKHVALDIASKMVSSEVYGIPPRSEQKLGNVPLRDCLVVECSEGEGPSPNEVEGPLDSGDSRIYNTWYAQGSIWGSLSTIVRVAGNIQAGAAWFKLTPSGRMQRQGYVANAGNNIIYPGIATLANGKGAMALNIVGRDWYPTAGYARVTARGPHAIHVAGAGAGPQDGLCEYAFENCAQTEIPAARPSWGAYPVAMASGRSIWLASEYIAQTCTFGQFLADFTCGKQRGLLGNWSTRLSRVVP